MRVLQQYATTFGGRLETSLHRHFAHRRSRSNSREWFRLTGEDVAGFLKTVTHLEQSLLGFPEVEEDDTEKVMRNPMFVRALESVGLLRQIADTGQWPAEPPDSSLFASLVDHCS